jgi:dihydroxy-acid dehydratase
VAHILGIDDAVERANRLAKLMDDDAPLGRALRPNGPVDRLLQPGGIVDQLTAEGGLLDRLTAENGAVSRALAPGGLVDQITAEGGLMDRMTTDDGALSRVIAPGGLADQLLANDGLIERVLREDGVADRLLAEGGLLDTSCLTVTGRSVGENIAGRDTRDREVIRAFATPLQEKAGFLALTGNLFDFAIMKTSVISDEFRARYLSHPGKEGIFEARAIVFEGSGDYHHRINDPALEIDENCILVMRGAGPIGWPGSAEVVNMQPPDALIQRGIAWLPTLGDGRQSGTSDSPSILNASPESAVGGGLAWLRNGDVIRIDLNAGTCNALVDAAEIARRKGEPAPPIPESHTPWEELYREKTGQLEDGGVLEMAVKYRGISAKTPRHNH